VVVLDAPNYLQASTSLSTDTAYLDLLQPLAGIHNLGGQTPV
jgi:hypothetical protein